jgi:hypothetical protein
MMAREYFFVSALHIGGDEQLKILDFEDEFVEFLASLEGRESDTELVIIGDAFGLWEFTTAEGVKKLDLLLGDHARLFEQFRATGERVEITLIPGNHDCDLACYPSFVDRLAEHVIALEQTTAGSLSTTSGLTKPPPVSSRCCNVWSPASQGATRSKTYRKERSSGRPPGRAPG